MIKYSLCKKGKLSLSVKLLIDEFGSVNIYFQHPLSGEWCENIDQILSGWSEETKKDNQDWMKLIEAIKKDDMLPQKIYDDIEIIEY